MSMQIWQNSSNSSANSDCDSVRPMRVTSDSIPPVLNTLDNSIFASLITDAEEKPIVNLKSDVISDADLQIGSLEPNTTLGLIYDESQPTLQAPNMFGVATTRCTIIPVSQQLSTLAPQDSGSYARFSYPTTLSYHTVAPQTSMEPALSHYPPPTSLTTASHFSLAQQHHGAFYLPPLQSSYPTGQSFGTSAHSTSSNHITWSPSPVSPHRPSILATSAMPLVYGGRRCVVCGVAATGVHYGALACDSCRVFFGTAIHLNVKYECSREPGLRDASHSLRCHSCRLNRCLAAGMCKDAARFEKSVVRPPNSMGKGDPSSVAVPPSIGFDGKAGNASDSVLSPSVEVTIKQIGAAESIVFDVAPVNLPQSKPLFLNAKECGSLQTAIQESAINLFLWSQNIPLFSEFSDLDRFTLLSSGCIELLLVHFVARLASFLAEPRSTTPPRSADPISHGSSGSNTSVTPSESPIISASTSQKIPDVVIDVLFPFHCAPEGVIFSQQAERNLRAANCWYESHILLNLLPEDADHIPISTPGVSNELSAQSPSRRLILCRLFHLAHLFKRLCLTSEAVGCLRMVILFNPDAPKLTKEARKRVECKRDEAFTWLEQTFARTDRKTALDRMAQLCLHLADLSFIAERISSKNPSDFFPSFQCIVDVLECFYKSDVISATAESCL